MPDEIPNDPQDTTESLDPQEEQRALEVCREILSADRRAQYRDVRREARDRGVKVTRRIFSTVHGSLFGRPDPEERPQQQQQPPSRRPDPRPENFGGERQFDPHPRGPDLGPRRDPPPWQRPATRQPTSQGVHEPVRPRWAEGGPPPRDPRDRDAPSPDSSASPRDFLGFLAAGDASHEAPRQNAVEFMTFHLRRAPEASYRQIRELAESAGFTVSAAAFARAQLQAGITLESARPPESPVPVRPPTPPPESPRPVVVQRTEPRREPAPTPVRVAASGSDPTELLEEFIVHFQKASDDQSQLRHAMQEMLRVIQQALA